MLVARCQVMRGGTPGKLDCFVQSRLCVVSARARVGKRAFKATKQACKASVNDSGGGNSKPPTPSRAVGDEEPSRHRPVHSVLVILLLGVRALACLSHTIQFSRGLAVLDALNSAGLAASAVVSLRWSTSQSVTCPDAKTARLTAALPTAQVVGVVVRLGLDARNFDQWVLQQDEQIFNWLPTVSIIVPVLNEAKCVSELCEHLRQLDPQPDEVIFVDGGSSDRCVCLCNKQPLTRSLNEEFTFGTSCAGPLCSERQLAAQRSNV